MSNKIVANNANGDIIEQSEVVCSSIEHLKPWVKPSISVVKINKLTAGYGPILRDGPVLGLGAS